MSRNTRSADGADTDHGAAAAMRFGRAPGAWPFLGHVVALQRRPLRLLDSLPACGDLVEVRLGPRPAFVVCHPDLARQVLTDFRGFDRAGLVYHRVRLAMGNGLATAGQQDHRRQRLIMQPAFRHEHLRGYVAVMRQEITAAMSNWQDGQLVDMVDEMFRLTSGIALTALFSSQLGSEEAERLRQAFDVFLRGIYARAVLPVTGSLPTPGNRRYARAVALWRDQVSALIDRCRQAGAGRGDLMSRLLAARDEQGQGMSDAELADQVAVLLLAGSETTWSADLAPGGAGSAAPVPARLGHPADLRPRDQPRGLNPPGREHGGLQPLRPAPPARYVSPAAPLRSRPLARPRGTRRRVPPLRRGSDQVHRRGVRPRRSDARPGLHNRALESVPRSRYHGVPGGQGSPGSQGIPGPPVEPHVAPGSVDPVDATSRLL
jgi:Cytochrome P450